MDEEPVTAYEVEEYPEEEEYGRRRITAGPIIAIVVVVILLISLGFYFFWGTSVNQITVQNIERYEGSDGNIEGISVLVTTLSSGAQQVEGTGTLEIEHSGSKVYSSKVEVKDDKVTAYVKYKDFVVENGDYKVSFSMEGKKDTADQVHTVTHVPERLEVDFTDQFDSETLETTTSLIITPKINTDDVWSNIANVYYYNRHMNVKVVTTDPMGETNELERSMYEWHQNKSSLPIDLGWDLMGNYSVSAEFTNLLVKEDSEFRTLSSEPEEVEAYINKAPLMGDITHSPSRVRISQEFELTVRAYDQDSNGGIEYFMIDWDADDDEDELEVIYVDLSLNAMARVSHTYEESGSKIITITAADNGYVYDEPGPDPDPSKSITEKKFASTTYTVDVRLI